MVLAPAAGQPVFLPDPASAHDHGSPQHGPASGENLLFRTVRGGWHGPAPSLRTALVKVNLEVFEGPLDLLLFLIRKSEIDIHDIPIAALTRDYVATLEEMESLDLNVAGDFLVMAAQLMVIKSRMLLPAADEPLEEGEAEDPRSELVAR